MNQSWIRSDLKFRAKDAIRRNYWPAVVVSLILAIVTATGNSSNSGQNTQSHHLSGYSERAWEFYSRSPVSIIAAALGFGMVFVLVVFLIVLKIFAGSLLEVGAKRFYIENLYSTPRVSRVLFVFRCGQYWNIVKTIFLRDLFTVLWSLLFVIPGIVKSYEYRMIPYLLAEYPDMPWEEAFERSRDMMYGEKWNAFVLDLSFLPWQFLSAITMRIAGLFYVNPYVDATNAELYDVLAGIHGNGGYHGSYSNGNYGNGSYSNGSYGNGSYYNGSYGNSDYGNGSYDNEGGYYDDYNSR